ncbi:MAG: ABC transporter ATP-binding protein [Thermacetogeniaceae bacterium]|nr:ABC transporter ATP-binding protein [Thermoanaerobacterales bacterium]NLN20932.1 ABC transporter ATP-binding protein [Syntrophomonadaceae bacterium]
MKIIRTENLTAGYNGTAVLTDINMHVSRGRMLGLLGRNGSGKTTLFRCLNGLLQPMRGKVYLAEQDISKLRTDQIANLTALVPQGARTVFPLYVIDMIMLGEACHLKAWQSPGEESVDKARSIAAEIGIEHLLEKQFDRLSGGEQQLVLIARALMQSAPILLLDEPTSHLDFTNQHMIMNLIRSLVYNKGVTTVITAHDPNIVLQYCDDVMLLKDGNILAAGAVDEHLNSNNLRALYGDGIAIEKTSSCQVVVPVKEKGLIV